MQVNLLHYSCKYSNYNESNFKRLASLILTSNAFLIILTFFIQTNYIFVGCDCGSSPTGTIGDGLNILNAISVYVPGNVIITSGCIKTAMGDFS